MIYISSSCLKHIKIRDSIQELVDNGYKNIELSGGTEYYKNMEDDILYLQEKYNLNYMCHNYFPPPKEPLVLNLASLNDDIYERTFSHLKESIELSKRLGSHRFSFHAGFFLDISLLEIGRNISKCEMFDRHKSMQRFYDGFNELKSLSGDISLYIENNVYSFNNSVTYNNEDIFMLTHYDDFLNLKEQIDFKFLLDVAHLKVSSATLKLDFEKQLSKLVECSDYIHISDNDSLSDSNQPLQKDSELVRNLKKYDLKNKDFTLEIYDGIESIDNTYKTLEGIIND